jgi:hypothetical protein
MAGSAMLTSAVGCVLALGAQQFRLHNSRACAVALSVGSLPVIEGCNVLVFVQYPSTWGAPENDGDKFANVQDFDWVRDGPSPHWRRGDGEEQSAVHAALQAVVDGADASTIQSIPCIQRNTN